MKLPDGSIVMTPYDSRTQFEPAWRHIVSRAWSDEPAWIPPYPEIHKDKYIVRQCDFLSTKKYITDTDYLPPELRAQNELFGVYNQSALEDTKPRLDALLLTAAPYHTIGQDIGYTPEDVETYEKLYFNIRTSSGQLTDSCYLRTRFSVPNGVLLTSQTSLDYHWKVVGAHSGYSVLVYMWRWNKMAHGEVSDEEYRTEIMRMIQSAVLAKLLNSQINNFDLNNFLGNYIQYERLKYDTRDVDSAASKSEQALAEVFDLIKPKMLEAASTVDENKEMIDKINAKFQSQKNGQKNIEQVRVKDKGSAEGHKALMSLVNEQFK